MVLTYNGGGKKITSYSLSPEAEGKAEYVSNDIASYIKYNCSYCMNPFYLVDPMTHESGGAIQRELEKNIMGKISKVRKEVRGVCLQCCRDQLSYQQSKYFW